MHPVKFLNSLTDRQTHTDGQTDMQTGRQTDRQADKHTGKQTGIFFLVLSSKIYETWTIIKRRKNVFFNHAITILSLFTYSACDEIVKTVRGEGKIPCNPRPLTWRWQFLSDSNFKKKWNLVFQTNQTKIFEESLFWGPFFWLHMLYW